MTLEKLFFSYYDIDNDRKELREEISTPYFEKAYLANDTTIQVIPRSGDTPPIFRSTAVVFTGFNNPDDPSNLTPEQKQHAVTFSFLLVSEFEVTFSHLKWNLEEWPKLLLQWFSSLSRLRQ